MSKFLGNAMIKINGKLVKTVPDSVELNFGGPMRQSVMADNTFNFNEKPAPSKLTFKVLVTSKTDVKVINELESGTVEILTDIPGKEWTQTGATRMGDPVSLSSGDGQMTIETEGDPIVP
jgi:Phage tail tube protein